MNVAIIGCGYVGTAVARHWRDLGCFVTATTTSDRRVAELEQVAQRAVLAKPDSEASLLSAIQNQEAVLLIVAPAGDKQVDAGGYEQTHLRTAENQSPRLEAVSNGQTAHLHEQLVNEESPRPRVQSKAQGGGLQVRSQGNPSLTLGTRHAGRGGIVGKEWEY